MHFFALIICGVIRSLTIKLKKVVTQRTFESGGLAIFGDNKREEVILPK